MTSMPRSMSMFWMSMTSRSLPGMAQDEKIIRSPALRSIAGCSPRAMRAMAARGSPWLPVQSTHDLVARQGLERVLVEERRARLRACRARGRWCVMRCSARPDITTWRPAFSAARAMEMTRPTLEAKVVSATRCGASAISAASVAATSSSLGLSPSLSALVRVADRARSGCPRRRARGSRASSVGAAAIGRGSSFQSPVWITRPTGVVIASAQLSGIEWATLIASMVNGPTRERLARRPSAQRDVVDDVVGGALGAQHRGGEGGGVDRPVEGRPEVEHGAVVVLVAVGEDQRQHVVGVVLEECRVGHDQLDARLRRTGEGDAAIDDDPLAARCADRSRRRPCSCRSRRRRRAARRPVRRGVALAIRPSLLAVTPKCTSPAVIAMRELSLARTISRPVSSMVSKMPRTTSPSRLTATSAPMPAAEARQRRRMSATLRPLSQSSKATDPFLGERREDRLGRDVGAERRAARSPDKAARRARRRC